MRRRRTKARAAGRGLIEHLERRVLLSAASPGPGTVRAWLFNDLDQDGVRDVGEGYDVVGGTVYVDLNGNGAPDAGEPAAVTTTAGVTLNNVPAGTYTVRAICPPGLVQTSPANGAGVVLAVQPYQTAQALFGATNPDAVWISGTVFDDANANGARDGGEAGLAGRYVYLDHDYDGNRDSGQEGYALTDADGSYTIRGVTSTRPVVHLEGGGGWRQTAPALGAPRFLTVAPRDRVTGQDFAATHDPDTVSLFGQVYDDPTGDGHRGTDAGLPGRTVWIDANNNRLLDPGERSTQTDADGFFGFPSQPPGTFAVYQVLPAGWRQLQPWGQDGYHWGLLAGQHAGFFIFSTTNTGTVNANVFNDVNADGQHGDPRVELPLAGRRVYVDLNDNRTWDPNEPSAVSISDGGLAQIRGAPPGTFTVRQVLPAGWVETTPAGGGTPVTINGSPSPVDVGGFGSVDGSTLGSIAGTVFDDANADGLHGVAEAGGQRADGVRRRQPQRRTRRGGALGRQRRDRALPTRQAGGGDDVPRAPGPGGRLAAHQRRTGGGDPDGHEPQCRQRGLGCDVGLPGQRLRVPRPERRRGASDRQHRSGAVRVHRLP